MITYQNFYSFTMVFIFFLDFDVICTIDSNFGTNPQNGKKVDV